MTNSSGHVGSTVTGPHATIRGRGRASNGSAPMRSPFRASTRNTSAWRRRPAGWSARRLGNPVTSPASVDARLRHDIEPRRLAARDEAVHRRGRRADGTLPRGDRVARARYWSRRATSGPSAVIPVGVPGAPTRRPSACANLSLPSLCKRQRTPCRATTSLSPPFSRLRNGARPLNSLPGLNSQS